ncbi:MAG: carbon-nitrogen family hydrolase [Anaerolineae bacterium]|nr:carbon-nitrogen family hydrolase [Anaerolineae bacterium]
MEEAIRLASQAAELGSSLILFPELWSSGYDLPECQTYARQNRVILENLCTLAKDLGIFMGGSLLSEVNNKIFNTFTIISPEGKITARYDKLHLFNLLDEDRWCQPGDHLQTVNFPWAKAGLAICYDTRFPELFRSYALKNATLLLICAEWPLSRINHWSNLIKTRAIENLSFVAAVNCVGQVGPDRFGGQSAIISPWGEVLVEGNQDDAALLTAEINTDQVARARRGVTALSDRRPDVYEL